MTETAHVAAALMMGRASDDTSESTRPRTSPKQHHTQRPTSTPLPPSQLLEVLPGKQDSSNYSTRAQGSGYTRSKLSLPSSRASSIPDINESIASGTVLRVVQRHVAVAYDELSLEVDEIIVLLERRDDADWWRGVNRDLTSKNGYEGWFPVDCVQVEGDGYTVPVTEEQLLSVPLSETATAGSDSTPPLHNETEYGYEIEAEGEAEGTEEANDEEAAIPAPVPPGTKVIARFSYYAEKADELTFHTGATIVVTEVPEGGWWRGVINSDKEKWGKVGWFPSTLVVPDVSDETYVSKTGVAKSNGNNQLAPSSAEIAKLEKAKKEREFKELKNNRKSWYKRLVKKTTTVPDAVEVVPTAIRTPPIAHEPPQTNMKGNRSRSFSAPVDGSVVQARLSAHGKTFDDIALPTIQASRDELVASISPISPWSPGEKTAASVGMPPVQVKNQQGRSDSDSWNDVLIQQSTKAKDSSLEQQKRLSVSQIPASESLPSPTQEPSTQSILPQQDLVQSPPSQPTLGSTLDTDILQDYDVNATPRKHQAWCDGLSDDQIRSLTPTERQRQTVIWELIVTERDYLRDLHIIMEVFKKPLLERKILQPKIIDLLFANIEQIAVVNRDLLRIFESKHEMDPVIAHIGDAFLKMNDCFIVYSIYCSNTSVSQEKFQSLMQTHKGFRSFCEEQQKNPNTRMLDLHGFLIKPVQRI